MSFSADMTKNLLDQLPLEIFERVIEYVAQDPVSFVVLSLTCRAFHEIWETLTPDTERAISLRTCTADMYGNRFSLQGLLAGWISQKEDMFYDWAADKYFTAEETEMIDIGFDDEVSAAKSRGQEIKERRRDRRERAREKRRKRANERYYSAEYVKSKFPLFLIQFVHKASRGAERDLIGKILPCKFLIFAPRSTKVQLSIVPH